MREWKEAPPTLLPLRPPSTTSSPKASKVLSSVSTGSCQPLSSPSVNAIQTACLALGLTVSSSCPCFQPLSPGLYLGPSIHLVLQLSLVSTMAVISLAPPGSLAPLAQTWSVINRPPLRIPLCRLPLPQLHEPSTLLWPSGPTVSPWLFDSPVSTWDSSSIGPVSICQPTDVISLTLDSSEELWLHPHFAPILRVLDSTLVLQPIRSPWLLAPLSPLLLIIPLAPPGSLIPPAPPWSVVNRPPLQDSAPPSSPRPSIPLASFGSPFSLALPLSLVTLGPPRSCGSPPLPQPHEPSTSLPYGITVPRCHPGFIGSLSLLGASPPSAVSQSFRPWCHQPYICHGSSLDHLRCGLLSRAFTTIAMRFRHHPPVANAPPFMNAIPRPGPHQVSHCMHGKINLTMTSQVSYSDSRASAHIISKSPIVI
ncbi:Intersectin-1 [Labeo rohita]|uniref:Intersectin-1 n=1 Tax=Labeo rohita TaxID=84645 RepID=A0ABQ8LKY6_LABRO|nr:Intersectin-1 [Labeo rohita]